MRSKISIILGERLVLVLCSTFIFGLSFNLLKVARDCALTCTIPSAIVPLAILVTSIFSLPAMLLHTLESRFGKFKWILGNLIFAGFALMAFRIILLLLTSNGTTYTNTGHVTDTAVVYFLFFIFVSAYFSIVLSYNAFDTVYIAFPPSQRKQPLIYATAALMAGGLLGSYSSRYLNPFMFEMFEKVYSLWLDPITYAVLSLLLGVPVIVRFFHLGYLTLNSNDKLPRIGLLTRTWWIWQEPKLRHMGFFFLTQGMVDAIGKCMMYLLIIQLTDMAVDGRTSLFSNLYAWLNIASLIIVAFGVERLFKSFGMKLSLIFMPAVLLCTAFVLRFVPSIVVLMTWKITEGTLSASLQNPGQNQLLLKIGENKTQLIRPLMRGFLGRLGEGLGAGMVLICFFIQGSDVTTVVVNLYIASLVMWLISIAALR